MNEKFEIGDLVEITTISPTSIDKFRKEWDYKNHIFEIVGKTMLRNGVEFITVGSDVNEEWYIATESNTIIKYNRYKFNISIPDEVF